MEKLYVHHVTVTPIGNFAIDFPIDMLRRDKLVPCTTIDSSNIERCFNTGISIKAEPEFSIELWREAEKAWNPTEIRWKSSLWKVTEHVVMG